MININEKIFKFMCDSPRALSLPRLRYIPIFFCCVGLRQCGGCGGGFWSHHRGRAPLAAPGLRSPQMSPHGRRVHERDAQEQEKIRAPHVSKVTRGTASAYPASSPRLGAHISTFMCHMIANPFTPARTRPERMASSPRIRRAAMATASCCASRRGGARSNLAHGTRRPQHERVQARGCKASASKESMRVCVLVCLSLGRSCPVPGCSSWASRFASRAP